MVVNNVYAGWNHAHDVCVCERAMRPGLPRVEDIDSVLLSAELIMSQHLDREDRRIAAWVLQRVFPSSPQSLLGEDLPVPVNAPDTVAFVAGFTLAVVHVLAEWDASSTWLSRAELLALAYSGMGPSSSAHDSGWARSSPSSDMAGVEAAAELPEIIDYLSSFTGGALVLLDGQVRDLVALVSGLRHWFISHGALEIVAFYLLAFARKQHELVIERLVREVCSVHLESSLKIFDFMAQTLYMGNSGLYVQIYTEVYFSWIEVYSACSGLIPAHEMAVLARRLHQRYQRHARSPRPSTCAVIACLHPARNDWESVHRSHKEEVVALFSGVLAGLPVSHHLPACLLIMKQIYPGDDSVILLISPLLGHFPARELEVVSRVAASHLGDSWQEISSGHVESTSRGWRMLRLLQECARCYP